MSELIKVPDIGGGEGEVIEILVQVGDSIEVEQSLVTLESDKASMELPSPKAGVVKAIKVKMGDTLKEGTDLIELDVAGADEAPSQEPAAEEPKAEESSAKQEETPAPAEKPAAKKSESSVQSFNIPDIGDGGAQVIEIMVAKGDRVEAEQSLLTLESDKASMEIPAPAAGVIEAIEVQMDQQVKTGDLMLRMRVEGVAEETEAESAPAPAAKTEDKPAAAPAKEEPAKAPAEEPAPAPVGAPSRSGKKVHAGPAVRKLAREFGIELAEVSGSGPRSRILKEDVQSFVQNVMRKSKDTGGATGGAGIPQVPEVDFSRFGEVELKDMTRLQQVGASNLHRSWLNVPHVTQFDLADISELEDFRKAQKAVAEKAGVKLTVLPFLLKACAHLLREQPNFNVSLAPNGKQLIQKNYVHIGFAVDTPDGLLVAVIRDVDKKSLLELAGEAAELADKARNKKLSANDMQGACFTISSLGHIGGTYFTPIVNTPEVAILGVSRATMQPVWDGKAFEPRLMLPLSLSYDHRAVNGAAAALFTKRLGELLGDIRSMLL
ncbi:pyruvate dehydrogenase E2 component (dihydrolipoamide acetyltransferase) [Halopseudomonas litoralis]|uniref:Acetyltransferase component of pyruvate dehydrogenase complex n=1 Tax=Halopseudomonas litoralis TaxID=797277 RepID=A0A1H1TV12_9GAMM|nr:dihydrolipoyllysine-residue acetyltransferase [Halopseudomonas litoralis]SDS64040.1 pyruvate dehydrogenase E2 component (dihydrolipoamide acetyltransferase) [Halopseudomonas litoralis]